MVNNDYVNSAAIQYNSSPIVPSTTNAGTYALSIGSASGLGMSNYNINYVPGILTINKAVLTVSAVSSAQFVGIADPVGFSGVVYSGLKNSDAVTGGNSVLGSATATVTRSNSSVLSAGTYSGVLQPSLSVASLANYTLSYVPADYTIVPAINYWFR